jgi:hypothetical protein
LNKRATGRARRPLATASPWKEVAIFCLTGDNL